MSRLRDRFCDHRAVYASMISESAEAAATAAKVPWVVVFVGWYAPQSSRRPDFVDRAPTGVLVHKRDGAG